MQPSKERKMGKKKKGAKKNKDMTAAERRAAALAPMTPQMMEQRMQQKLEKDTDAGFVSLSAPHCMYFSLLIL